MASRFSPAGSRFAPARSRRPGVDSSDRTFNQIMGVADLGLRLWDLKTGIEGQRKDRALTERGHKIQEGQLEVNRAEQARLSEAAAHERFLQMGISDPKRRKALAPIDPRQYEIMRVKMENKIASSFGPAIKKAFEPIFNREQANIEQFGITPYDLWQGMTANWHNDAPRILEEFDRQIKIAVEMEDPRKDPRTGKTTLEMLQDGKAAILGAVSDGKARPHFAAFFSDMHRLGHDMQIAYNRSLARTMYLDLVKQNMVPSADAMAALLKNQESNFYNIMGSGKGYTEINRPQPTTTSLTAAAAGGGPEAEKAQAVLDKLREEAVDTARQKEEAKLEPAVERAEATEKAKLAVREPEKRRLELKADRKDAIKQINKTLGDYQKMLAGVDVYIDDPNRKAVADQMKGQVSSLMSQFMDRYGSDLEGIAVPKELVTAQLERDPRLAYFIWKSPGQVRAAVKAGHITEDVGMRVLQTLWP